MNCRLFTASIFALFFFCLNLSAFGQAAAGGQAGSGGWAGEGAEESAITGLEEDQEPIKEPFFDRYYLSLGASFGAFIGQNEEIVFQAAGSSRHLSSLVWQMKPLLYLGFSASISPKEAVKKYGLYSSFSVKAGIPGKSGLMQDRDWQHPYDLNEVTEYSEHENWTRSALLLNFKFGWNIPARFVSITPYALFSSSYFYFSAQNGWGRYRKMELDVSSNMPILDDNGNVIYLNEYYEYDYYGEGVNFSQFFISGALGLKLYIPFKSRFSFELFAEGGFVLSYTGKDSHTFRNVQFLDTASDGLDLSGGLLFNFCPLEKLELSLSVKYRNISGVRGNDSLRGTGVASAGRENSWVSAGNVGGAALSVFDVGLSANIKL